MKGYEILEDIQKALRIIKESKKEYRCWCKEGMLGIFDGICYRHEIIYMSKYQLQLLQEIFNFKGDKIYNSPGAKINKVFGLNVVET